MNHDPNEIVTNNFSEHQQAGGVEITYYTDPLCCWSWAFEPQWRRLQYEFGGQLNFRYRMGGLLPGWNNFHDPVNSVSRPIQMGPVWMHASQLSGMPIEHNLWMKDPPASSYPACIAFKCVELQSPQMADKFLRLLREAVMMNGRNIAKSEVLQHLAETLRIQFPDFDISRFRSDLTNENGREAFRLDLTQVRYHAINRFPTLIMRQAKLGSVIVTGYRPYPVLTDALQKISAGAIKTTGAQTLHEYALHFPDALPREIQEAVEKN